MPRDRLSEFELLVILAALRLGPEEAYTVSIADTIEEKADRRVRRANVHTALQRLEAKGLVATHLGEPRPERGGKPRRLVDVTPDGLAAIKSTTGAIEALSAGLDEAIGGAA
ncbi:MAG: PadR family transcriptional regulator [Gemmatimonadetes bacterium]|nr:PadR family transcriptional regulator [Gemmatimonadota bacterium]